MCTLSGPHSYVSGANQIPHRRDTLVNRRPIIVHIRVQHPTMRHLMDNVHAITTPAVIHIKRSHNQTTLSLAKHTTITSEPFKLLFANLTDSLSSRLLCHCNHLSLTRYPNHNTKHTTTRRTKHDTPERKKIDKNGGAGYTINNKTKSRQSGATQPSRHQRNQQQNTPPVCKKNTA